MNYRCQHCGETFADAQSKAARETCYIAPMGRHKLVEIKLEDQAGFGFESVGEVKLEDFYGVD